MWSPPFKKAALGLPFFVSLPSKSLVRTKCRYGKYCRCNKDSIFSYKTKYNAANIFTYKSITLSEISQRGSMSKITELKDAIDTKTLNLILLTIATAGIYPFLWMFKSQSTLESVTKRKITDSMFITWLAVCAGLGGSLSGTGDEIIEAISGLFTIGSWVLFTAWAFRAREALKEYALNEHNIDLKVNAFYTFVFTIFYINYCINDLPEAKRKKDLLSEQTSTEGSNKAVTGL